MNKWLKYIFWGIIFILIIYFSFNIENLQEYQAKAGTTVFDATEYAHQFWNESLPQSIAQSPEINHLLKQFNEDPTLTFEQYGKKLGISKTYYFMLNGNGEILSVENEHIPVLLNDHDTINLATVFIFGNAVRDGSGMINIDHFVNMTDFNNVSIAINRLVKEQVVSHLKKSAQKGKHLSFAGVAELKEDQTIPETLNIIPVKVILSDGKTE